MAKHCSQCSKVYSNDDYKYCPHCGGTLYHKESVLKEGYSDGYNLGAPSGYVYDFGGHLRPDPEELREQKRRSEEAFRDRW